MPKVMCNGCGVTLASDHEGTCPECGHKGLNVTVEAKRGRLTDFALDTFVAPKISQLSECSLPDMSSYSSQQEHWISNFILNSIFRMRLASHAHKYIVFFLRRAEGAFREYENARHSLLDYIDGDRHRVSVYFKSLFHFETCIAQMWQALQQFMNFQSSESGQNVRLYAKGDDSAYERLNTLYNYSRYAGNNVPEDSTLPMWLTPEGIEGKEVTISYQELGEILGEIGDHADLLSNPPLPEESGSHEG